MPSDCKFLAGTRVVILSPNMFPPQNASLLDFLRNQLPTGLEMLRQMVQINSFTGNRQGVNRLGRFTAECFAPLGFTAEYVPSIDGGYGDHLVLTRPGRSPR